MAEREVETGPRKRVGEVRPRAGFGVRAGWGRGAAGPDQPRGSWVVRVVGGPREGRPEAGGPGVLPAGGTKLGGRRGGGGAGALVGLGPLPFLACGWRCVLGDARCQTPLLQPRGQGSPWKLLWGEVRWGERWREEVVGGLSSPGGCCSNTEANASSCLLSPPPLTVIKTQSGRGTLHLEEVGLSSWSGRKIFFWITTNGL